MNNEQLAAAIVALFKVINTSGDKWSDIDELIQRHAFEMWNAMAWSAEAMALYLFQHGWTAEAAGDFVDISTSRVWAVVREYEAQRRAQETR